jgi:hypothetical protein
MIKPLYLGLGPDRGGARLRHNCSVRECSESIPLCSNLTRFSGIPAIVWQPTTARSSLDAWS